MTMKTETILNSVEVLLRNQRKGKMLTELSEQMQRVALAAREHGQAARLTLTLTVLPASTDGTAMSVADEIKIKLPEPKKARSLFFVTDDGCLVRNDPNQTEMKLEIAPNTNPAADEQTDDGAIPEPLAL